MKQPEPPRNLLPAETLIAPVAPGGERSVAANDSRFGPAVVELVVPTPP